MRDWPKRGGLTVRCHWLLTWNWRFFLFDVPLARAEGLRREKGASDRIARLFNVGSDKGDPEGHLDF